MQMEADYSQQHKENKYMVSKKLLTIQECQFNLPDDIFSKIYYAYYAKEKTND